MRRMKSGAIVAMVIGVAVLNTPVVAGEAEDVAMAHALIESLKASREASIRASLRAVAALRVVYNCDKCALNQIIDKTFKMEDERSSDVEEAYKIMRERFYKEEIAK